MMKKIILLIAATVALLGFFSYKLIQVPSGITGDEAAFGYNAILLSRTLHDENGRKLPVFVLSLNGTDWRQPVTQYFITAYFKIFGPSLFNLRFTSVLIAVVSIWLIYFLGKKVVGSNIGGTAASIFLATTPIFMMQSHLGLDNIYPIPFVIVWLIGLYQYKKTNKKYWLIISSFGLGFGFYAYKAMRIFIPVWVFLSLLFIAEEFLVKRSLRNFKKVFQPILFFAISFLPFIIIIPLLEFLYAGAVLNNEHLIFPGIYNFTFPYLSNFDPSFLFIKGDDLLFHSTGIHGMYLLASLPFFIAGLFSSWKRNSFWKLIIISFFLGPILFGFLGSVHRASRLLAEIPLYSLICTFGFLTLWTKKAKFVVLLLIGFFLLNYFDFLHYYLWQYADTTRNLFNCFSCSDNAYRFLKDEAAKENKTPYVDEVLANREGEVQDFAQAIYFLASPKSWDGKREDLPENAILMTDNSNIKYLRQIGKEGSYYYYVY